MPKFHLMSRAEMLQWCHDRSTRIDNDVVSIVVNKQRAAVENLIFKFGTDSDLVETYWDENNLIDLFSADYLSLSKEWTVEKEEQGENEAHLIFSQAEGYRVALNIWWSEAGITVEHLFQLPQPICINNNIAVGGKGSPKPRNDHWAMRLDGKVVIGDYAYEGGAHVFLCPTDGTYLTPEGCWVAAWNEDVDEVCGFTFSPNCGCIIGRGASTDFEFYLPAGESTLRFHVAKPKPDPPYRALQKWACNEEPVPLALDTDGEKPLSPFVDDK